MTDKRFKKGDKVRCLISGKTKELHYDASDEVTVGKVYLVTQTPLDDWNLFILGDRGYSTNLKAARFELVEENQMQFKPGDRVRALRNSTNFTLGNVYVVRKQAGDTLLLERDDNGSPTNGWYLEYFELVFSQSELQTLVDQANAGFSALRKLRDWNDNEIEMKHTHAAPYRDISGIDMSYGFTSNVRIKPKTKKFRVASWDAEINGANVTIGCKKFNIKNLKVAMQCLLKGDRGYPMGGETFEFTTNRFGIATSDGHTITWEQAEQLLKELES